MPVPCRSILQASAVVTTVLHKLINQPSSHSVRWLLKFWKWSIPRLRYSGRWRRVFW